MIWMPAPTCLGRRKPSRCLSGRESPAELDMVQCCTYNAGILLQENAVKTKHTHPYNYDPIVQFRGPGESNGNIYTDRLLAWDRQKHDHLCEKHFGDRGQYWDRRAPEAIESFLRDWLDDPALALCRVTEHCNVANGFPVWHLEYQTSGRVARSARFPG